MLVTQLNGVPDVPCLDAGDPSASTPLVWKKNQDWSLMHLFCPIFGTTYLPISSDQWKPSEGPRVESLSRGFLQKYKGRETGVLSHNQQRSEKQKVRKRNHFERLYWPVRSFGVWCLSLLRVRRHLRLLRSRRWRRSHRSRSLRCCCRGRTAWPSLRTGRIQVGLSLVARRPCKLSNLLYQLWVT